MKGQRQNLGPEKSRNLDKVPASVRSEVDLKKPAPQLSEEKVERNTEVRFLFSQRGREKREERAAIVKDSICNDNENCF